MLIGYSTLYAGARTAYTSHPSLSILILRAMITPSFARFASRATPLKQFAQVRQINIPHSQNPTLCSEVEEINVRSVADIL